MVFNFHSLVRLAGDLPMQTKELYSCAIIKNSMNIQISKIFKLRNSTGELPFDFPLPRLGCPDFLRLGLPKNQKKMSDLFCKKS